MTAAKLMDSHPKVVHPNDTILTGIGLIMKYRYRRLPVVDDEGIFQGVFGVNCLLRLALPKAVVMQDGLENINFVRETLSDLRHRIQEVENEPISICMLQDSIKVAPDLPLLETLRILYLTRASLPVVDEDSGKLLGIISYFDAGAKIMSAQI